MLNLSVGRKLSLVMDLFEKDGEVELGEFVFILDADNNLFTKGKKYTVDDDMNDPNSGTDVYFDANDTSLKYILNQLEKKEDEYFLGLMANNALRTLNKKR